MVIVAVVQAVTLVISIARRGVTLGGWTIIVLLK